MITSKMTIGFDEQHTNKLMDLSKKLKRSRADTIRRMIDYGYKKFVMKDSSGDEDMRLEEEVLIG